MAMLKTVRAGGARSAAGIEEYLLFDKAGARRALAVEAVNLAAGERGWGAEIDGVREAMSAAQTRGRKGKTSYYHFVLSPDPADEVDAQACLDYAREWAQAAFGRGSWQYAIVVHDDSAGKLAAGLPGITHAHIVVSPYETTGRKRMQIAKGEKARRAIERGDKGPEFVHKDVLADLAQELAAARGWHAFDNSGDGGKGAAAIPAGSLWRTLDLGALTDADRAMVVDAMRPVGRGAHVSTDGARAFEVGFSAADAPAVAAALAEVDAVGGQGFAPGCLADAVPGLGKALTPCDGVEWERIDYAERRAADRGALSWKQQLRESIDSAARRCRSYEECARLLAEAGIHVRKTDRGLVYRDREGHYVSAAQLGARYTYDGMRAMFEPVDWRAEAARQRRRDEMEMIVYFSYRFSVRGELDDIERRARLLNQFEHVIVREGIERMSDFDARYADAKAYGGQVKAELLALQPEVDRAGRFLDVVEQVRYSVDFAGEHERLKATDPAAASRFYGDNFLEIDRYWRLLGELRDEWGLDGEDAINGEIARCNSVNARFSDLRAQLDGTARRLADLRSAKERALWVDAEVRRLAREKATMADVDLTGGACDVDPGRFYTGERAPWWMLNVTREQYQRIARRDRAARANFRRAQPELVSEVPRYMAADAQVRRSLEAQARMQHDERAEDNGRGVVGRHGKDR